MLQEARRYQPGWAARHLADLRVALGKCGTVEIGGNPNDRSTLTIVAADFAGDGSLLIRDDRTTPEGTSTQYHAVVRRGDVQAELRIHIDSMTEAEATRLSRTAATRLCAATSTC